MMNNSIGKWTVMVATLAVISCGLQAREMGHYSGGVANIRDMAMPDKPGFYYQQYNVHYQTDDYNDKNGDSVDTITIGRGPFEREVDVNIDVEVTAISPTFVWITDKEILGGRYGFYAIPQLAKSNVAARLGNMNLTGDAGDAEYGLGDLYVRPLWLGWNEPGYSATIGAGAYLPVGDYEEDAVDNVGLGFWTAELQASYTLYLDELQASALMLGVTYEFHGEKEGTNITPGDHLTLDYGFSQYLSERVEVGVFGFSSFQLEGDSGGNETGLDPSVKIQVHGYGAQLGYWITPRLNLAAKYSKEYSAEARFEGEWFMLNLTYLPFELF